MFSPLPYVIAGEQCAKICLNDTEVGGSRRTLYRFVTVLESVSAVLQAVLMYRRAEHGTYVYYAGMKAYLCRTIGNE